MAKNNDDGFSLDDMMEIFGEAPAAAPKPSPAPPVAVATQPSPAKPVEDPSLNDDELAILEAYERSRKDQKIKSDEARRKKEEEAKRILEDYERSVRETEAREAREKKEREARHQRELEELKKKEEFKLDQAKLADEEAKIIEEFERQAREQKEREEHDRQAKEASAQEELKQLALKQRQDEERQQAEEVKRAAELQAKANEVSVSKKDSRLLELLAKAQQDIQSANNLTPLPGAMAGAPAAAPRTNYGDVLLDIETKENESFSFMLDETRKAMFTYLAPVIGIKSATNMLNKTVEKARVKAPVLMKDANWKLDGSLREDGSVDPDRLLGNAAKLPAASRAADYVSGLRELVSLRVKTVEAGLGANAAAEMKAKLQSVKPAAEGKKISPDWVKIFMTEVVDPA